MNRIGAWFGSVRGRITIVVTALFALVMVLGSWFLLDTAERAWIDDLEAQDLVELELLAQDLEAMELFIGDQAEGGQFPLPVGAGGTSFTLVDELGVPVAETPSGVFTAGVIVGEAIPLDQLPPGALGSMQDEVGAPEVVDVVVGDVTTVTLPVELAGGTLTLMASSSLGPVQAGLQSLGRILWLVIPVLVAGVGAMTWFVTGRAFRPVEAIADQVERITDDRLDERIPVPASRDEVAHLAETMNTMLQRLAIGRDRQRQFVSDASHELRNPVATSKATLEVALSYPEREDWDEVARVVLEEQDRLSGLIDDLLLLARLDEGRPASAVDVDLDDIVFAEADRLYPVDIDVSAVRAVRVLGDQRQLTGLVRNLIDNAARHADRRVAVALDVEGDEAVLAVEDDGPGIPAETRVSVFDRFVRVEDARSRNGGGAGLGLAIVRAIADAHGGIVCAGEGALGGARFEFRLPHRAGDPATPTGA